MAGRQGARTLALLLALMACSATALQYRWVGGQMNFADARNWKNGLQPTPDADVGVLNLKAAQPYTATIDSGNYATGKIVFPMNGKFRFDRTASTKITFKATANQTKEASFLGPRDDPQFDFDCITNYQAFRVVAAGPQEVPFEYPMCADHVLKLTSDKSYYFFSKKDTLPVLDIDIDDQATTAATLPMYQFDDIRDKLIFGALPSDCEILDANGDCFCPNSCPTPAQELEQNDIIRTYLDTTAKAEEQRRATIENVTVTYEFDNSVLGFTASIVSALNTVAQSDLQAGLEARIVALLTLSASQVDVTSVTTTAAKTTVVVDLSAPRSIFLAPSTPSTVDIPGTLSRITTGSFFDAADATPLDKAMQSALQTTATETVAKASLDGDVDADSCQSSDGCGDKLLAMAQLVAYFSDPASLLQQICPNKKCLGSVEMTNLIGNAELSPAGSLLDVTDLDRVGNSIVLALSGVDFTSNAALEAFFDQLVNSVDAAKDQTDDINDKAPSVEDLPTPIFDVGRNLPAALLHWMVNTGHIDTLKERFTLFVRGITPVIVAKEFDIQLTESRRRAVAPHFLRFEYTAACGADRTLCQIPFSTTANSPYQNIKDRLDSALSTFSVDFECYMFDSRGWDEPCVVDAAKAWARKQVTPVTLESIVAYVLSLIKCDERGYKPDDLECYADDPASVPLSETLGQQAFTAFQAEASKSGSSSSAGMGMVIGIVAALVVLAAIVVIVVMRRRSNNSGSTGTVLAGKDQRSVVAFENPMYEDGRTVQNPAALYDGVDMGDNHDLYDEPAMNMSSPNRQNPAYQSMEDIGATTTDETYQELDDDGEEVEGGGYLDVAAGDEEDAEEGGEYVDPEDVNQDFGF